MRKSVSVAKSDIVVSNVTPVWLLVYWRLVRGEAAGDYAVAWRALPSRLPEGISPPSIEVASAVLVAHGLA